MKHLFYFQIFLLVELPLGIITILHTISSTIHDFLDYSAVKSIVLAVNLCICLSYPLNFGIYCGMSRQFRETFKELFIHRVTGGGQHPGDGITRANSQSRRQVSLFLLCITVLLTRFHIHPSIQPFLKFSSYKLFLRPDPQCFKILYFHNLEQQNNF